MRNLFQTLNKTYDMNIKPLTETYEKSLEQEQRKLLKGVAEFFGAKSIVFQGGEEYNDEEYYDDLLDLIVDGKSARSDFKTGSKIYQKLFNNETPFKEEDDEEWEQWDEIKSELMGQLPEFIKTKTTSYELN